ncbi:MAG: GNAT family protein [Eubacteriales bacterium]|nr:GNAT family protein [Eubacteriales bacterium]
MQQSCHRIRTLWLTSASDGPDAMVDTEQWLMAAQQRLTEAAAAQTVVVTDSQRIVSLAIGMGLPCIGIEAGADRLSAPFIFEDPGQIDEAAVEMAYCRFHGLPLIIAQTARLRIREMTEADIGLALEWAAEAAEAFCGEVTKAHWQRQIDTVYPLFGYGIWLIEVAVVQEVEKRIEEEIEKRIEKHWRPIGLVGFGTEEIPDLGFFVCQQWRRLGMAFEAAEAAIAYMQEQGYRQLVCEIDKRNVASQRLAARLGFTRQGSAAGDDRREQWCRKM